MPEIIKKEVIDDRLKKLRAKMAEHRIDCVIITGADFHNSEYSSEYFATRKYFSGFTGSAGVLIITEDKGFLFTDGRYFIQAELQLESSGIILMKQGVEGTPTIPELITTLACGMDNYHVAFDGRTVSSGFGEKIESIERISVVSDFDATDGIWSDRPDFPSSKVYALDIKYTGESSMSKIDRVRVKMSENNADVLVVSSLDDIAWLTNLRGSDVECNPVFMSYMLIFKDKVVLYLSKELVTDSARRELEELNVKLKSYEDFYSDLEELNSENLYWIDKKRTNFQICSVIKNIAGNNVIQKENPIVLMKAIKNETEIRNLENVNAEDGACVAKMMFKIKEAFKNGNEELRETDVADYVDRLRSEISDYVDLSFPTISAFGKNAAQMHYSAVRGDDEKLKAGEMILVDSGGQYLRGTTDITRTVACGECDENRKRDFTLVLKGMLALSSAIFLRGCSGYSLDILARSPMWKNGIDYRCGTGHGVGYMLNVHESPNAFRWRYIPEVSEFCEIVPGMVTTDEPGIYKDGEYGIRTENDLVCVSNEKNEYGEFLSFKSLTLCPIDLDLVIPDMLEEDEKKALNEYHALVYDKLSPLMSGNDLEMLEKYTRAVE